MDHLVIAHVVQVCSNLQLSLKEMFVASGTCCNERNNVVHFLCYRNGTLPSRNCFFFTKRSRFSELHPVRRRIEVHVSMFFVFQSSRM